MRHREWLRCKDAQAMVRLVWTFHDYIKPRRYRLFVLKAGERLWNTTDCEPLREAIELVKSRLDSPREPLQPGSLETRLRSAWNDALQYDDDVPQTIIRLGAMLYEHPEGSALELIGQPVAPVRLQNPGVEIPEMPVLLTPEELLDSCRLMREFFGTQSGPPKFEPQLFTTTAVSLAKQIDETQDFSLMPLLADALEDAGC